MNRRTRSGPKIDFKKLKYFIKQIYNKIIKINFINRTKQRNKYTSNCKFKNYLVGYKMFEFFYLIERKSVNPPQSHDTNAVSIDTLKGFKSLKRPVIIIMNILRQNGKNKDIKDIKRTFIKLTCCKC